MQRVLTNGSNLYTYLDKNAAIKGEPINIIIADTGLAEILDYLKAQGWQVVPTFSLVNKDTWSLSIQQGITPVSPRYYNGNIQDISLEGSDSSIFKRHHARFWAVGGLIYGAVSYDSGVTIVLKEIIPIPSHTISQNIDLDRDTIGKLIGGGLNLIVSYKDNISPVLYQNNNAGSWYYTDGETIVVAKSKSALTASPRPAMAGHSLGLWLKTNFQETTLAFRREYFKIIGLIMNLF